MSSSTSSSKPNNDGGTSLAASNEDGETPSAARSAANKNRLSANLCQKRPHKKAANNNEEEDDENNSSYADMDSFSLHLPITNNPSSNRNSSSHNHRHSQRSSDDSSDDTSTSDVTWLTYRDEKCNEVKEEFMKRLKIETKNKQQLEQQSGNTNNNNNNNKRNSNMLSVEERRMLLENIVRELGRREEVEKERRKREERDGKMNNDSHGEGEDGKKGRIMVEEEEESIEGDYLTEEEVEDDDSDEEEGGEEGAGGTHPAALFDSIGNFRASPGGGAGTGGGGSGDPPSSSSFHYHDPQLISSGITMGGLDLVKEETRSDIRAAGGSTRSYQSSSQKTPSSQGDSYNNNINNNNINNTTTTTDQQLQQIIHQDHINSIVNLKLLVANQQTIIDALASKLHQAELSNDILQSENKILNKNNEMQQQQLIQKTREVMEMKREQQEQRRRLTTTTSVTTSDAPSVLSSSSAAGAAAAAATGGANTTTTKNNMSQEQFTIRALESKLQQMDQMNKLLVQENTQLRMSLMREKSKGGGGTGTTANDDTTVDDGLKDSVEQQKEEVEGEGVVEREGEDAVVETKVEGEVVVPSLPLSEEEQQPRVEDVPPPEGGVKVAPSLLPEEEEQPREEEVPPSKEVVTDSIPSSSGPSLNFLRNKLLLKSQAASERSSSSGKASVEITKNNARKTTRFADQQDRYSKTVSGVPPRKYGQEVSSSDSGTGPVVEPIRYKSQIASSNRLLGDTKLRNFSGLANRLGISRLNSTGRLNSIMRVEDLSKELIPIVGEPKFCAMIYNVLTPEECTALIRRAKAEQFEELSYYRRGSMKGTPSNISCCKRCRLGDSDLAVSLLQKILLALKGTPLEQAFLRRPSSEGDDEDKGHARAVLTRISEPFNVIRYDVGEFFAPHRDTTFRTGTEVSRLTLQVFLNEKFNGGTTSIRQGKEYYDIKAKAGSVLLFDQDLRREECYVVSGKKYVLRADIMYDESKADVVDGATAVTESAYTRESGYTRETSNPAA